MNVFRLKTISLLFCFSLYIPYSLAHPGIGIVKDSKGNIYYTDLKQVWKVEPDGKKKVVVSGVHTHELYMDPDDNLYGEHLWYNGEQLNTWGHYVWCLKNNGSAIKVIDSTDGFLQNYSFVRDSTGNMYWVVRGEISYIKKKNKEGIISTIAEGRFKDIRWMYSTQKGEIYFIDLVDLYKIESPGKIKLLAKSISSKTTMFALSDNRHSLFGIWKDKEDNIYVANYTGKAIKQVSSEGIVKKIASTSGIWGPTGGLFDEEGNLWILESSITNDVRVRKILKEKLGQKPNVAYNIINNILPVIVIIISLVLLFFFSKKLFYRFKRKFSFLVKKTEDGRRRNELLY